MKDGALRLRIGCRRRSWIKGRDLFGFTFSVILRPWRRQWFEKTTLFEENEAANHERRPGYQAEKHTTKIAGAAASKQLVGRWKEKRNTEKRNDRASGDQRTQ